MNLEMCSGYLSVEKITPDTKTPGGIYVPTTAQEGELLIGKIIAVCKTYIVFNTIHENLDIRVGDKIIYEKRSGRNISIDGKEYVILRYADVMAKIADVEKN